MLDTTGYQSDVCIAFENEVSVSGGSALKALSEMVQNLPESMVDDVLNDLEDYELTGIVSDRIEIVLKRTMCLVTADRIAARH